MFKAFKDARRRVTEKVLETAGATDRTTDPDYDLHYNSFQLMLGDLNECGAAISSVLVNQKQTFADARELGNALARLYAKNAESEYWNNSTSQLKERPAAIVFSETWQEIHEVLRSSTAKVCAELALEPVKTLVTTAGPEIEGLHKERQNQIIDYDSYRRRLKEREEKKTKAESEKRLDKIAELEADIIKFKTKEANAGTVYRTLNQDMKEKMVLARAEHDRVVDDFLVSVIVTQAELFTRAAEQLQQLASTLPQDKVLAVRSRIESYVSGGGVSTTQSSQSQLALDVFTGRAVPNSRPSSSSALPVATPVSDAFGGDRSSATAASLLYNPRPSSNPFAEDSAKGKSNPFADEDDDDDFSDEDDDDNKPRIAPNASGRGTETFAPPPPPQSTAPPLSPTSLSPSPPSPALSAVSISDSSPAQQEEKKHCVVALFDSQVEADDELEFMAGDQIEVMETGEDGWWKGRCRGKEGLFPVNFVKA